MRVAAAALFVCTSAACRDPTQVTVVLTTDANCADVKGVMVTVGDLGDLDARPITTETSSCSGGRIGDLVVVPSGPNDGTVAVRALLGLGKDPAQCVTGFGPGCIVARRAIRYVPHTRLTLPILLSTSCQGVACAPTDSCVDGACRPVTVDGNGTGVPCACGPTPPDASFTPVAFADDTSAACPAGLASRDLQADPVAAASACGCSTCALTTQPDCTSGTWSTVDDTAAMPGVCTKAPGMPHQVNGGACLVRTATLSAYAQAQGPAPVGGACDAPGAPTGTDIETTPVRVCEATPGACACGALAPFAACLQAAGDVACPPAAPHKHLVGTIPLASCTACPCTIACAGTGTFYADAACAMARASVSSTACTATGGGVYQSTRWMGAPATCSAGTAPPPVGATFKDAATICCP
jgi:hypothetical protein